MLWIFIKLNTHGNTKLIHNLKCISLLLYFFLFFFFPSQITLKKPYFSFQLERITSLIKHVMSSQYY